MSFLMIAVTATLPDLPRVRSEAGYIIGTLDLT